MKKTALLFCLLFVIPIASALQECKGTISPLDVPCMIVSTWQYPNACNTYTIKIYDDSPALLNTITMGDYGLTGRCNITMNYTRVGTYLFNTSVGDSITIYMEGDTMYMLNLAFWAFLFLLVVVFIYLTHKFIEQGNDFAVIYGMISAAISYLSAAMIFFGFKVIDGLIILLDVNYYLALINLSIGIYCTVLVRVIQKNNKEPEDD